MFLLSWQLSILSLGLTPFFLYLTYRVGKVRREVSTETQKSLAEMTATTEETLSVSGILLSKTFGQLERHEAPENVVAAPRRKGHDQSHGP